MSGPHEHPLLKVENLQKTFYTEVGEVHAVQGVSFDLKKGETLGLVGESGSGKSTLGRCVLRLIDPTAGKVFYKGTNLLSLSKTEMRHQRKNMQMIFQDPFSALNPRMTIEQLLVEPLHLHKLVSDSKEATGRAVSLLKLCGLQEEMMSRYPHEFSGGQRQRICIARALAVEPEFLVCDEPVSALDVSVQAQILSLLLDLQQRLGLTLLFISHDLRVIRHVSDRIAVMVAGRWVEELSAQKLEQGPDHPYTKTLVASLPKAFGF
jgi:oligopeptide transport system ATP-binding protein